MWTLWKRNHLNMLCIACTDMALYKYFRDNSISIGVMLRSTMVSDNLLCNWEHMNCLVLFDFDIVKLSDIKFHFVVWFLVIVSFAVLILLANCLSYSWKVGMDVLWFHKLLSGNSLEKSIEWKVEIEPIRHSLSLCCYN